MNPNEIKEALAKLKSPERMSVLLNLMLEEKMDFIELSRAYIDCLKIREQKNKKTFWGLAMPLATYWQYDKTKDQGKSKKDRTKLFTKVKAAYHLLRCEAFKDAEFEKDLEDFLGNYEYSEDEAGHPKFTPPKN